MFLFCTVKNLSPSLEQQRGFYGSKQHPGLMLTIRTPLALRGPILINVPKAVVPPPNPRGPTLVNNNCYSLLPRALPIRKTGHTWP